MKHVKIYKAYGDVLLDIHELITKYNIEVNLKPSNSKITTPSNSKITKEYNEHENMLPLVDWLDVRFLIKTDEQRDEIYRRANILFQQNISFASGAGFDFIEWKLDWSFKLENI